MLSSGDRPEEAYDRRFSPRIVAAPFGTFGQIDFSGSRMRSIALSYGAMFSGTLANIGSQSEAPSVCGPATSQHAPWELVCLSQSTGELLDRLPLPGELSAAPLFHNGSWIVATTKGFLFRSSGLSERGTPVLGGDNTAFWGANSRSRMGHLRNLYRSAGSNDQSTAVAVSGAGSALDFVQSGWDWYHWSSSPFVTPLLVQGSRILAATANQFVYAIEIESGKIAWAQRIGTSEDLQVQSRALAVTSRYVVAGTAEGGLSFLNAVTGKAEFQIELPRKAVGERFVGVVSQPLVAGQRIVASSTGSSTVMVNERSQKIEWEIQHGSIASPRRVGETVFLGTVEGRILKLELQSGAIAAERQLGAAEPVASLTLLAGGQEILVAMREGSIHVLRAADLLPVQYFDSQGPITGEWIGNEEAQGSCITTLHGRIRCFASMSSG
jgi:outer membrane protein assembly factor BamB